jgi:hypothetical protein
MPRKKRKIAEVVSTEQATNSKVEKTPENDQEMVRQASKLSETIGKPNSKKRSETASELMSDGLSIANDSQTKPQYAPTDDKYVNRPDLNNRIGGNYRYAEENLELAKDGKTKVGGNTENKFEPFTRNPNDNYTGHYLNENLGAMSSQYAFDNFQNQERETGIPVGPSNFFKDEYLYGLKGVIPGVSPGEQINPIQNGQKLVETISSDANNTVTDKVILEQIQNAESPEEIAKIKADAEAAKIEEQKQKEQLANQNSALLNTIHEINHGQQGQRDSFDQITTIQDVQRGVLDQYKNQASNVPYAVVEKLGIQDYYPNAGRDIAVGTFSGSRIGSQTIYSGAGALLPVGLYDARKRSLVEAAKNIQKKKDEFLQVPNAPQQFNADFQQAAYSQLYDIGAKHDWNMNAIMKDKEAMQRVYAIKNAAKDLAYTDEIVNNIFETLNTADGKTASYVPEDILQKMIEYRQGKLDVDAILSGENNVLELAGEIRNYANGTAWADKNLPEWKSDPVSLPLNLKTDKEITMDNLNEMNQTIEKAKVSGSYDSYITAIKKYFHLDPKVVDAWVEQNMVGATPEQKQKVVDDLNTYILAQMPPESIEEKIENLKNDNYNYWAKRQDLARYDKERETIMTRAINTANQAKLKDQISAINNDPKLNTPQKKRTALMNAYRKAGFTPTYNKETGQVYGSVAYSSTDPRVSNVTYNSDRAQVWVRTADQKDSKGRVIKKGKYEWAPVGKVLANKKSYSLNESELTELNQFAKGGAKGTVNETRMFETFVEGNNAVRVSENNINKYAKSQQKGIGTETFGNVIIVGQGEDGKPTYTPGKVKVKIQLNPETNPTDRNTLDAIYKKDVQNVSTDVGFDAQGPASNY